MELDGRGVGSLFVPGGLGWECMAVAAFLCAGIGTGPAFWVE